MTSCRQVIELEARSHKTSFVCSSRRVVSILSVSGSQYWNCPSAGSQRKIAIVAVKRSGPSASATGNGGPKYTRLLNPGRISVKSASSSSAWATITAIARLLRMSPNAIGMSHNRRTCILIASLYRLSIEQRAL